VLIRLHEPAVALTDLAVGVEAVVFAFSLARATPHGAARTGPSGATRTWFMVFFAATGVAAIAGAALHGLLPPGDAPARRRIWRVSLGSIGVAGLSSWCLAALLALPYEGAQRVRHVATAAHAIYLVGLTRTNPPYAVAIATYLPGAIALCAALLRRLGDRATRGAAEIALAGLGLTFGAAAVQVRRIALHPRLFDHNATYHAIQAIAIACFYGAAQRFIGASGPPSGASPDQTIGRR
jgi:hypothetical protein